MCRTMNSQEMRKVTPIKWMVKSAETSGIEIKQMFVTIHDIICNC